jgi:ATP phosphoribosyltransferase regulatory subunit
MAPYWPDDVQLQAAIRAAREAGDAVIVDLPGHDSSRDELRCSAEFVLRDGSWLLEVR